MNNLSNKMNILAKNIFKANKEKGFWTDNVQERNKSEILMLIVSELAEAQEALRKNDFTNKDRLPDLLNLTDKPEKNGEFKDEFGAFIKNTFEDELADAIIRILDLCGALDIDIETHIDLKLKYNSLRPHKHGKSF